MAWADLTDPTTDWSDTSHPEYRHTIGAEYGKTTRIRLGDHIRIGGLGWNTASDPTTTGADITDPSTSWSDASGDP